MMTIRTTLSGFFGGAVLLFGSVISVLGQETGAESAQRYVVVKKDTLWDISRMIYGDPYSWKGIHEANTDSIKDPNLIYPEQTFVLPNVTKAEVKERSKGQIVPEEEAPKAAEVKQLATEQPPVEMAKASPVKEEPVEGDAVERSAKDEAPQAPADEQSVAEQEGVAIDVSATGPAHLVDRGAAEVRSFDGKIIAVKDGKKVMLSQGDEVYVDIGADDGLLPGDTLDIVRKVGDARSAKTGERFWLTDKLGKLKVTSEVNDRRARCRIVYSHTDINVGDGVLRVASGR